MGLTQILRSFGFMLLCIGVAALIPAALSLWFGEGESGYYLFGSIVTLVCAAGALTASRNPDKRADFRSVLIIILLFWIVLPLFSAIPFSLGGLRFGDAYFEAVSALSLIHI